MSSDQFTGCPSDPAAGAEAAIDLPDPIVPSPSVSALLAKARQCHAAYRTHANDRAKYRDYAQLESYLRQALDLRRAALLNDPQLVDPAWVEDQALMKGQSNQTLMAFYEQYLITP